MNHRATETGIDLLETAIAELEDPKGSGASAIRTIRRAAELLDRPKLVMWCRVQQGEPFMMGPLQQVPDMYGSPDEWDEAELKHLAKVAKGFEKSTGLRIGDEHGISLDELQIKQSQYGGGWADIVHLEQIQAFMVRAKLGEASGIYIGNLSSRLSEKSISVQKHPPSA